MLVYHRKLQRILRSELSSGRQRADRDSGHNRFVVTIQAFVDETDSTDSLKPGNVRSFPDSASDCRQA